VLEKEKHALFEYCLLVMEYKKYECNMALHNDTKDPSSQP